MPRISIVTTGLEKVIRGEDLRAGVGGEMVQSVKYLPQKHEDLSSSP